MVTSSSSGPVEVRNRFDGRWSAGYDVAEVDVRDGTAQYRVRRCCDGSIVPGWFSSEELRTALAGDFPVDWQIEPPSALP
jgi:hypothetical protein